MEDFTLPFIVPDISYKSCKMKRGKYQVELSHGKLSHYVELSYGKAIPLGGTVLW